jgi:hypothetical protein
MRAAREPVQTGQPEYPNIDAWLHLETLGYLARRPNHQE